MKKKNLAKVIPAAVALTVLASGTAFADDSVVADTESVSDDSTADTSSESVSDDSSTDTSDDSSDTSDDSTDTTSDSSTESVSEVCDTVDSSFSVDTTAEVQADVSEYTEENQTEVVPNEPVVEDTQYVPTSEWQTIEEPIPDNIPIPQNDGEVIEFNQVDPEETKTTTSETKTLDNGDTEITTTTTVEKGDTTHEEVKKVVDEPEQKWHEGEVETTDEIIHHKGDEKTPAEYVHHDAWDQIITYTEDETHEELIHHAGDVKTAEESHIVHHDAYDEKVIDKEATYYEEDEYETVIDHKKGDVKETIHHDAWDEKIIDKEATYYENDEYETIIDHKKGDVKETIEHEAYDEKVVDKEATYYEEDVYETVIDHKAGEFKGYTDWIRYTSQEDKTEAEYVQADAQAREMFGDDCVKSQYYFYTIDGSGKRQKKTDYVETLIEVPTQIDEALYKDGELQKELDPKDDTYKDYHFCIFYKRDDGTIYANDAKVHHDTSYYTPIGYGWTIGDMNEPTTAEGSQEVEQGIVAAYNLDGTRMYGVDPYVVKYTSKDDLNTQFEGKTKYESGEDYNNVHVHGHIDCVLGVKKVVQLSPIAVDIPWFEIEIRAKQYYDTDVTHQELIHSKGEVKTPEESHIEHHDAWTEYVRYEKDVTHEVLVHQKGDLKTPEESHIEHHEAYDEYIRYEKDVTHEELIHSKGDLKTPEESHIVHHPEWDEKVIDKHATYYDSDVYETVIDHRKGDIKEIIHHEAYDELVKPATYYEEDVYREIIHHEGEIKSPEKSHLEGRKVIDKEGYKNVTCTKVIIPRPTPTPTPSGHGGGQGGTGQRGYIPGVDPMPWNPVVTVVEPPVISDTPILIVDTPYTVLSTPKDNELAKTGQSGFVLASVLGLMGMFGLRKKEDEE